MKADFYNLLRMDTFSKKLFMLSWALMLGLTFSLTAQEVYNYSGIVRDQQGSTMPGVNVIEKGTTNGTITDIDGKFTFTSPNSDIILTVSMVGYMTIDQAASSGQSLTIEIAESVVGLDEVLVVGYGTQKRANVTSAISTMNSDQVTQVATATIDQAMQGRMAGVNVIQSSGAPGSQSKVVIRGVGTNGNSNPLYVVDGLQMDNIDDIEPYDVESIEVLKDAASAAIYGANAANGVVLVTTKKGKAGKGKVNYNFQYFIESNPKMAEMMDGDSYKQWLTEIGGFTLNENEPYNTNWLDEVQTSAPGQRHHLSFSGGTEKGTYYISGAYLSQDGIIGGDQAKFQRVTLRTNTQQQVKKWLQVGVNANYQHFDRKTITEDDEYGGMIASALMLDPLTPVTYKDQLGDNLNEDKYNAFMGAVNDGLAVQNSDGSYYGVSNYVGGDPVNPLAMLEVTKQSTVEDRLLANTFLKLGGDAWKGFSFTSRINVGVSNQLFHDWYPSAWYSSEKQNTSPNTRDNVNKFFGWQWDNFANYDTFFGKESKHGFHAMIGMSARQSEYKYVNSLSGPMFKEQDNFAQHGDVEIDGKVAGNLIVNKLTSYFGRVGYDYDNRYLVQVIVRRDGSSLFASDYRWGTFPSVSAGWIVSHEKFWNVDFIDFFKVRASWGKNGSLSNLQPDQFRALITSAGIKYPKPGGGYYTGAEPELLANPELVWEESTQTDIGFDMHMWNSRFLVGFDWFYKVNSNLLTPGSPPPSVGNYAPFVNAGDVTNKGVELELGLRKFEGKFNYDMNFNFTWLTNEVTYLNPLLERQAGASVSGWTATWMEQNNPVWYFRGFKTDGVFQSLEEISAYKAENGGLSGYDPEVGDIKIVNTNGDDLINNDDQVYMGDPHPDFMWGANFNFSYYGFDLRLFIQGVHGQEVLMGFNSTSRAATNRPQFFFDDRWTPDNPNNEWPSAEASSEYVYNSDLMIFDGSYIRIRQIQLGYTLPRKTMDKLKIDNLRFYVSLDDFFTFNNYPGMDAIGGTNRDNSQGIDRGLYPSPRRVLFGLTFGF